jgi:hypothetical protein
MLHDSGQRRRLEPGTEVGGAKPTPSPFLCATITLESPVKLSLQAPKSSGPSTHFLLPFRSHFTLICRMRASHLVTSAFADLGVNLLWSDLQGIFQLGYSNYYLSAPPPRLSAYTFSNGSRTIYFGLHSRSNRGNPPWLAPSNADRQAHPSAAEAMRDSFTNPPSRVDASTAWRRTCRPISPHIICRLPYSVDPLWTLTTETERDLTHTL